MPILNDIQNHILKKQLRDKLSFNSKRMIVELKKCDKSHDVTFDITVGCYHLCLGGLGK